LHSRLYQVSALETMYQSVTTNGLLQRLFCSLELPSILLLAITLQLWCCTSRISTRILSAQKTYF